MPRVAVAALLSITCLWPAVATGQDLERRHRPPRLQHRVLAAHFGDAVGEAAQVRQVQWRRDGDELARGVRVVSERFEVERVRFPDAAAAAAYVRTADAAGRVVERRGEQVVVLSGEGASDPVAARRALTAAWDVLPGPHAAGRALRGLRPLPPAPPQPARPRSQQGAAAAPPASLPAERRAPRHGLVQLLGHHLNDEPLDPLGSGELVRRTVAQAPTQEAIGAHQRGRIAPAYEALSHEERAQFERLLHETRGNPAAQAQLLKALAAGNDVPSLRAFARKIADRDPEWLRRNLTLTGTGEGEPGVKQQFGTSCGPTTAQAVRGCYDPVFALAVRERSGDVADAADARPFELNHALAIEQQRLLEAPYAGRYRTGHGVSTPRNRIPEGRGRWVDDHLNAMREVTGLTYQGQLDPSPQEATRALNEHLRAGRVVPLVIGSQERRYAHYVLATSVRDDPGGGRSFLIHDPWEGAASWVSERSILAGTMRINDTIATYDAITQIEIPTADKS